MLQGFASGLLCAGLLFGAHAFASNHDLLPGISMEFKLPANEPQEFSNPLFWPISSTCTMYISDENNDLSIEVLRKSAKINGKIMSQGDALLLTIYNKDEFTIVADSGAKVRLTNQGSGLITARCST